MLRGLNHYALNTSPNRAQWLLFLWRFAPTDGGMGDRGHAGLHGDEQFIQVLPSLLAA